MDGWPRCCSARTIGEKAPWCDSKTGRHFCPLFMQTSFFA
jgi:hypothetical protein